MFLPAPPNDDPNSNKPLPTPTPAAAGETQGDQLYDYVHDCLAGGSTPKEVRTQLIALGHSVAEAERVVAEVVAERQHSALPQPSALQSAQPDVSDEAYCYALERLLKGSKPGDVRQSLMDSGHSATEAARIVQTALQYKNEQEAMQAADPRAGNSGGTNMLIGGAICVIGIAVTLLSLQSGSSRAIIAWGAILFGGIQFFRGVAQSTNRSQGNP